MKAASALLLLALTWAIANESPQQRPARFREQRGKVYKDRIVPYWFATNTQFWYRNDLPGGDKEFILVNAETGQRKPAFDHIKLAKGLSTAVGKDYTASNLPFETIEFSADGKTGRLQAADKTWQCDLGTYTFTESSAAPLENAPAAITQQSRPGRGRQREGGGESNPKSPDGKWMASIKDFNVVVKSDGGEEIPLTTDGKTNEYYGRLEWSPDSRHLVAWRIAPGERKEVHLVQSSPQNGGRARLTSRPYALPGDRFTTYELNIFDVQQRQQKKPRVDKVEHEWLRPRVRWSKDGKRFAYQMTDRGHQRLRVMEVDVATGEARAIVDERSDTFIWTAHTETLNLSLVNWLENSDELIYVSEKSGWRHLYLVDSKSPELKPITKGEWVVRGIDRIDEDKRQIWFRANGVFAEQDPYLVHYGRVNFDGSGLVWLTQADGNHSVQFSPDEKYLIATYSRVDLAPANELRRTYDGKLICKLEEADISELKTNGWKPPEVFVTKARDGKTDIWGIIVRPANFDLAKKYPVIEDIYAGPQGSFVPKTFSPESRYASLANLGFIIVKVDGMGTANRSKAFHDVCYKNLKDAGFEDRIAWMRAAAKKYPAMDLSRVGVYGTSAGGQNAAAAVLFHPDFYKAAVASCGCHDNRMDKASWNEQWMGYMAPEKLWSQEPDNWYAKSSNIDNAHRLKGKLMLIVGEMDNNVPPESTYRFVDALIKARKDFDFIMVPGVGHGNGGTYGARRRDDFFVKHLLGIDPPDRNNEAAAEAASN